MMDEENSVTIADDPMRPAWLRMTLAGRVTVSSAGRMHELACRAAASGRNVSVCCAAAVHLDVAAIQVILCLGRDLVSRGAQCEVANVPDSVGELFRMAGVGAGS